MKKKYRHTQRSEVKCFSCDHSMKKNLIERKPTALNCYRCYSGARKAGYKDIDARQMRVPRNLRLTRRELFNIRKSRRARLGI
jgi:hypothetical protein